MNDLVYKSLCEMAEDIPARKISPVELVDAHLSRIDRLNPKLNAFVCIDHERARAQAKAAEVAVASHSAQSSLGPLHGVPITTNSSIDHHRYCLIPLR